VRVVPKKSLASLVAGALLAMIPAIAEAQPMSQPGTQVFGASNWGYFPCVGIECSPTGGVMSITEAGGVGLNSASTAFTGVAPGASGAAFLNYLASAQLQGVLGMAQLKALVQSVEMTGAPPGYTSNCCYYYDVNAVASALQWYSFTGTQPETFRISYIIDAILQSSSPETLVFAGVEGGISIWDGTVIPGLELEQPLGTILDISRVALSGTMANVFGFASGFGSVSFTLQPGAGSGFFMQSFLSASVPQQVPGMVLSDASNTMNTMFTSGNTNLLQARLAGVSQAVVPEPSTYALMSAGLAAMALVARRRRRMSRA